MRSLATVLVLACAASASADEVVLKSGRRVSGVIVEETERAVVLDIGAGQVGFPRASVERIGRGPSTLAEYRRREAALRPDDLAGWLALARWARERDLGTAAAEAFERVIALEPDNAVAREALGYERVGGTWLAGDAAQRARGLVPFEGEWMTPAEQAARLAERTADREQRAGAAAARARAAEAEARVREAEARARQAEDERTGGIPVGAYGPWGGGRARPCRGVGCDDTVRRRRPGPPPQPTPTPRATPVPCTALLDCATPRP